MNILECVEEYVKGIKKNPYVYGMQKFAIDIFINYIEANNLNIDINDVTSKLIDKLLLYWVPKNKKYLTETQAYQLVYTIHDLYEHIIKSSKMQKEVLETPAILDIYGEEYIRLYKVRNMLLKATKDPVISVNPVVIDLNNYKDKKKKSSLTEMSTTYEQSLFQVQECKEGGQIIVNKLGQTRAYKLLLEYPTYKYFKNGDLFQGIIKRKFFYVYWEIEEIKSYFPPQAAVYF